MTFNRTLKLRLALNLVATSVVALVLAGCGGGSTGGGGSTDGGGSVTVPYKVSSGNGMFLVDWSDKKVAGVDQVKVEVKKATDKDFVAAGYLEGTDVKTDSVGYSENGGLAVSKADKGAIKNNVTYDVRVTFLKGGKQVAAPTTKKVTPQAGVYFPSPVVELSVSGAGSLVAKATNGIVGLKYNYYWGVSETASPGNGIKVEASNGKASAAIVTKLTTGETYYAEALALNSDGARVTEPSNTAEYSYLVPPEAPRVTYEDADGGFLVRWGNVSDAQGYRIYLKSSAPSASSPNSLSTKAYNEPFATFKNNATVIDIDGLNSNSNYVVPAESNLDYYVALVSVTNGIESKDAKIERISGIKVTGTWEAPTLANAPTAFGVNGEKVANTIEVKWTTSTGKPSYDICYRRQGSSPDERICINVKTESEGASQTYVIQGLENGATYIVQLRSADGKGVRSKLSDGSSVTVNAPTPDTPALALDKGLEQIFASWSPVDNAATYNLYILKGAASGLSENTKGTATKIELSGTSYVLPTKEQHAFAVEAVAGGITSVLSAALAATPYTKSTDAGAINPNLSIDGTTATLTWTISKDASYAVYYSSSPNPKDFKINAVPIAKELKEGKFTHSGLTKGANVYYQVKNINTDSVSNIVGGAIALGAPEAPKNIKISDRIGGFDILFDPSAGAVTYNVYISTKELKGDPTVFKKDTYYDSGSSTARSFLDLVEGQQYYVYVTAQNEWGEGAFSERKEVTTLSVAKVKPASSPVPSLKPIEGGLVVTWPAISNANNYKIYLDGVVYKETSALGYTLAGLEEKKYHVQVQACNGAGCANKTLGAYDTPQAKGGRQDDIVLTAASWGVAAGSSPKIEVTFPKASGSYNVELYVNGTKKENNLISEDLNAEPNKVSAIVDDAGVYNVYVKLNYTDGSGAFAYSNVVSGVAYAEGAISNPEITSADPYSGAVTLQWDASNRTDSSYRLEVTPKGETAYNINIPAYAVAGYKDSNKIKYEVRPLTNGQTYTVKITEVWNGVDVASAEVKNIKPKAKSLVIAPTFDADLAKVFNPLNSNGGTLNWNSVPTAPSYNVYSSATSFSNPVDLTGEGTNKRSSTTNSMAITAPEAGKATYYVVTAVDVRGIEGAASGQKCINHTGADGCAKVPESSNKVTGLEVDLNVAREAKKVALSWSQPTKTTKEKAGTTRNLAGYRVYYKQSDSEITDAASLLTVPDNSVDAGSANVDGANILKATVTVTKVGKNYIMVVPVYAAEGETVSEAKVDTNDVAADASNVVEADVSAKAVVSNTVTAKATTTNTDGKNNVVAVTLTFDNKDITAGTTYSIYRSISKDAEGTLVASSLANYDVKGKTLLSSNIAVAGDPLQAGTTYYYTIAAFNAVGKGETKQVEVTTLDAPVVTGVEKGTDDSLTITMNKVADATSYQAESKFSGTEVLKSTPESAAYKVKLTEAQYELVSGKNYAKLTAKAFLKGVAGKGTSESSRVFDYALKPVTPGVTVSGQTVTLTGVDKGANKIKVFSASATTEGGAGEFTEIDGGKINVDSLADEGKITFNVTNGSFYKFKVQNVYDRTVTFDGTTPLTSEQSDASNEVAVRSLDTPANGSWSADGNTIALNWDAVKGAVKYTLKYNDGSDDVNQDITDVPVGTTSLNLNVEVGQTANSANAIDYSTVGKKVINSKATLGSKVSFNIIAVPAANQGDPSSPLTLEARTLQVTDVATRNSANREQINVSWVNAADTNTDVASAVVQVFKYKKDTDGKYTDVPEATQFYTETFTQQKDTAGVLQPLTSGSISVIDTNKWKFFDTYKEGGSDKEQSVPYFFKVQTISSTAKSALVTAKYVRTKLVLEKIPHVNVSKDDNIGMTFTWKAPQVKGKNAEYVTAYVSTIIKKNNEDLSEERLKPVELKVTAANKNDAKYSYEFKDEEPLYLYKLAVYYKTLDGQSEATESLFAIRGRYPAITNTKAATVGSVATLTWNLDAPTGREPELFMINGKNTKVVENTAADKTGKVVRTGNVGTVNSYEYKTTIASSSELAVVPGTPGSALGLGILVNIPYTFIKSPTGVALGTLQSGKYNVKWSDDDKGSGLILEAGYQVLPVGTAPTANYTPAAIEISSPGVGTFKTPTVKTGEYAAISFRYDEVGKPSDTFVGAWTGENLRANVASPVVSDVQIYNNIWTTNQADLGYMTAKVTFAEDLTKAGVISKIKVDATGCVELERTNGGFTLPTPNNTCITDITGSVATIKVKAVSGSETTSLDVLTKLSDGSSSIEASSVTQTITFYAGKDVTNKVDVKPIVLAVPTVGGRKLDDSSVSVSWDAVTNAKGYKVYYKASTSNTASKPDAIFNNVVGKIDDNTAPPTEVPADAITGTTATISGLAGNTTYVDVAVVPLINTVKAVPGVASIVLKEVSQLAIKDIWFNVGANNKARVSFKSVGELNLGGYTVTLKASKAGADYGEVTVPTAAGNTFVPAPVYLPLNVTTNTTDVKFTLTLTNNSDATDVKTHVLTKSVPFVNFANGNNLKVAVDYSANKVTVTPVTVSKDNPKLERCSAIDCSGTPVTVATALTNGVVVDSNITVPSEGLYYRYSGGGEVIAIVKANPVNTLPEVTISRTGNDVTARLNTQFSIQNVTETPTYTLTGGSATANFVNDAATITVDGSTQVANVNASLSDGLITYTALIAKTIVNVDNFTFTYNIKEQRFDVGAKVGDGSIDFNYVFKYKTITAGKESEETLGSLSKANAANGYKMLFDPTKGADKTIIEKDVFHDGVEYIVNIVNTAGVLATKTYQTQNTPTSSDLGAVTYKRIDNYAEVGFEFPNGTNYKLLKVASVNVTAGQRSAATAYTHDQNRFTLRLGSGHFQNLAYYVVAEAGDGKEASVYGLASEKKFKSFGILGDLSGRFISTTGSDFNKPVVTLGPNQFFLGGVPIQDTDNIKLNTSAVAGGAASITLNIEANNTAADVYAYYVDSAASVSYFTKEIVYRLETAGVKYKAKAKGVEKVTLTRSGRYRHGGGDSDVDNANRGKLYLSTDSDGKGIMETLELTLNEKNKVATVYAVVNHDVVTYVKGMPIKRFHIASPVYNYKEYEVANKTTLSLNGRLELGEDTAVSNKLIELSLSATGDNPVPLIPDLTNPVVPVYKDNSVTYVGEARGIVSLDISKVKIKSAVRRYLTDQADITISGTYAIGGGQIPATGNSDKTKDLNFTKTINFAGATESPITLSTKATNADGTVVNYNYIKPIKYYSILNSSTGLRFNAKGIDPVTINGKEYNSIAGLNIHITITGGKYTLGKDTIDYDKAPTRILNLVEDSQNVFSLGEDVNNPQFAQIGYVEGNITYVDEKMFESFRYVSAFPQMATMNPSGDVEFKVANVRYQLGASRYISDQWEAIYISNKPEKTYQLKFGTEKFATTGKYTLKADSSNIPKEHSENLALPLTVPYYKNISYENYNTWTIGKYEISNVKLKKEPHNDGIEVSFETVTAKLFDKNFEGKTVQTDIRREDIYLYKENETSGRKSVTVKSGDKVYVGFNYNNAHYLLSEPMVITDPRTINKVTIKFETRDIGIYKGVSYIGNISIDASTTAVGETVQVFAKGCVGPPITSLVVNPPIPEVCMKITKGGAFVAGQDNIKVRTLRYNVGGNTFSIGYSVRDGNIGAGINSSNIKFRYPDANDSWDFPRSSYFSVYNQSTGVTDKSRVATSANDVLILTYNGKPTTKDNEVKLEYNYKAKWIVNSTNDGFSEESPLLP